MRAAYGRNAVKRGVLAFSRAFCGVGGVVYRLDGVRGFLGLSVAFWWLRSWWGGLRFLVWRVIRAR